MPQDTNYDFNELDESHPPLWEAKWTKANESQIRAECYIPKNIKIHFDLENWGIVVCLDSHEVCLYEAMFQAVFRLPFLFVVCELLHHLDLAPHQPIPNAWGILYDSMVLWPLVLGKGHQLTTKEFLHLYRVQKNLEGFGV